MACDVVMIGGSTIKWCSIARRIFTYYFRRQANLQIGYFYKIYDFKVHSVYLKPLQGYSIGSL